MQYKRPKFESIPSSKSSLEKLYQRKKKLLTMSFKQLIISLLIVAICKWPAAQGCISDDSDPIQEAYQDVFDGVKGTLAFLVSKLKLYICSVSSIYFVGNIIYRTLTLLLL